MVRPNAEIDIFICTPSQLPSQNIALAELDIRIALLDRVFFYPLHQGHNSKKTRGHQRLNLFDATDLNVRNSKLGMGLWSGYLSNYSIYQCSASSSPYDYIYLFCKIQSSTTFSLLR